MITIHLVNHKLGRLVRKSSPNSVSRRMSNIVNGYLNIFMMVCESLMNNLKTNLSLLLLGLKSKLRKQIHIAEYHLSIMVIFGEDGELIDCPSQSLALKWLREVYKLHIYAKPYWPQGNMRNKMSWQGFIVDLNTINGDSQCYADSYEEAIESRIRFALEKLI